MSARLFMLESLARGLELIEGGLITAIAQVEGAIVRLDNLISELENPDDEPGTVPFEDSDFGVIGEFDRIGVLGWPASVSAHAWPAR